LLSGLLAVASLSIAVMAGPVGADHKPKHNPGGGSDETSTVEATGGFVTPAGAPQGVIVVRDNKNVLKLMDAHHDEGVPTFEVEIRMTETARVADTVACEGELAI
jgi:hypothetical protein